MPTPVAIAVDAKLECEFDGSPVLIRAREGVIVVAFESTMTARAIFGQLRRFGKLRSVVVRLNDALLLSAQRLELHIGDRNVLAMGADTNSGLLRIAGIKNVQVWPFCRSRSGARNRT